jgi:hypothetical protein
VVTVKVAPCTCVAGDRTNKVDTQPTIPTRTWAKLRTVNDFSYFWWP